jgi:hypothetical protein
MGTSTEIKRIEEEMQNDQRNWKLTLTEELQ